MPKKIAIVGAGVLGRVLAWQWINHCQDDIELTLYHDKPLCEAGSPSFTAAGMLTPYCELADADSLIFELGMEGLKRWPIIAEQLGESIGFRQGGSLIVAHPSDQAYYQQFQQQVARKLGKTDAVQELNRAQLADTENGLTERFQNAMLIEEEAWLDSQLSMSVLAQKLEQHPSIRVRIEHVKSVSAYTVETGTETHRHDLVYDCRGLGAKQDMNRLRGVRGEVIWLRAPDVNISHLVRLMHPRYRLYLVPRANDIYLVGASQLESEFAGSITVRSALELLSAVYSIHSGFSEAEIIKTDANLRPAFDDNQPKVAYEQGLIHVNGLFRHGYLLAPIIAEFALNAGQQQLFGEPVHPSPLANRVVQEKHP